MLRRPKGLRPFGIPVWLGLSSAGTAEDNPSEQTRGPGGNPFPRPPEAFHMAIIDLRDTC